MPITALPHDTARAIGSTSVISDPCSVVKELLDNALDASATSVFIEISQNTVDVIQVKDNGCGIPPSDHALVCKRAHTSKIATVEDLKKIGGSSLGFRGEALASTAEISGGVTVTTRVDTEPVASVIRYGRDGGVISVQRASHPVGTTVRVTDLFKHIPVRRQTTLKNTTKTLARVKRLIQEYAAAQPSKRLSLKVLKAKNENGNWMYAPKPNTGLLDAALKIAGTDVASTCALRHWPIPEATSDSTCIERKPDCRMTALVLDPNADLAKASNLGQYISIDGRPISASRGIGKNIAKIYKSYVRSTTTVTDPFLCLHVYCNEAMYDVNIEPAKDDVLFENTPSILEAIEELCRNVYGDKESDSEKRPASVKGKEPVRQRDGFELLLASSQSTSQSQQSSVSADEAGNRHPTPVTQTTPQPSSGRVQGLSDDRRRDSDIGAYSSNRESLNPWTITKIITPVNRPDPASTDTSARRLSVDRTWPSPGQHHNSEAASRRSSVASCLPSPSASNSSPTSNSPPDVSSSGTPFPISQTSPSLRTNYAKRAARERDRERYGNGSLDTWFGKTTQVGLSRIAAEDPSSPEEQEESLTQLAQERFGSETQPSPSQSTPAGRSHVEDSSSRMPNSPLSTASQHSPSGVPTARPEPGWKRLDQWSSRLHELSQPTATPGLAEALDFENRKREAIQTRREQIRRRQEQSTPASSPHLNRYLAARAALSEDRPEGGQSGTAMNPHDPRAYLMRHRAYQENNMTEDERPRRINTNKLPFENIPDGGLHKTGLVLAQDLSTLAASFFQTSRVDMYTESGCQYEALTAETEPDIINLWSSRLSGLIKTQFRDEQGSMAHNVQFDFSSIQ